MRRYSWFVLVFVLLIWSASVWAGESASAEDEPIYQGKTLSEWIEDLKDPEYETQRTVVQSLAVFGPKKEVVSALTTALKNEDAGVVLYAAQTLGKFGLKAKEALPELRVAYKRLSAPLTAVLYSKEYLDMFAAARRAVAEAIILIEDHPGPELAPFLVEALKTDDADKRRDIIIKLGKLGPDAAKTAVPVLIAILHDTDAEVRASGRGYELSEKTKAIRLEAVKSLGRMGPAAKPALHALTLAMKIAAPAKSPRVVQFEGSDNPLGSADAKRVTYSFTIVTGDKAMLQACAEALGRIRPEAKGTVGALRWAMRDLDEGVRWAALSALLESGLDKKEFVPTLLHILHDKDADLRCVALEALGKSGAETKQILPLLTHALKDENASVRESAAKGLGYLRNKAKRAAPALIAALKDTKARVREAAAEALGKSGVANKEVIEALIAILEDKEKDVFQAAGKSLARFGPQAKAAVPRLLALLRDSEAERRLMICLILGSIGPSAKEAISPLAKISQDDPTQHVRLMASAALAKIDSSRLKDALPRLTAALQGKGENDTDLIEVAAMGLVLLGRDAREVLPNLRTLRDQTSDGDLKKAIGVVIEAIQHPKKDVFDLE